MKDATRDVLSRARGAVVGVISATSRGSGYVALPNGVVVTSLDVVGYERDVQLALDDGSVVTATVVRANVALDVALVVPNQPLGLPPLAPAGDARVGDPVTVLGRAGAGALACKATIASLDRTCEGFEHLQIDAVPDELLRGGPLLDAQGNVIGLLVRPRRSRSHGDRNAYRWIENLVLPCAAFEGGLTSVEGPPEEILEYVPEYGCPGCDTIFEPDMDRCLECGTMLPHRWSRAEGRAEEPPPLKGLFAVKSALASMGIPANRARVGARTWRFSPSFQDQDARTQVDVTTDGRGDHLVLRAPLVRLPGEGYEPFYRHLLTLNDESAGSYRFSVFEHTAYLSAFEPVGAIDAISFPSTVSEFTTALAHWRAHLARAFDVQEAFEHELDG